MITLNNLLQIIITILVLVLTIYLYRYLEFRKHINKFPGRKTYFLLGDVVHMSKKMDELFKQMRIYAKEFPNGYRLWAGPFGGIAFIKAQDFEVILSNIKYIYKKHVYLVLLPWLGSGLLTSNGDKWHRRRKILTPAFHFNVLKRFVTVFVEHSEKFVQNLEKECFKDKTNVTPLFSKLTLDLISETAMGIKLNSINEKEDMYIKAIHNLGPLAVERIIRPEYYITFLYFLSSKGRMFKKYVDYLHKFTTEVIKERERTFKEDDIEDLDKYDEDNVYKKKRFAMLDLLISAKKAGEIDDKGIREEVDTFMFEGHDTTTMALSFLIFNLANNPDIQDKVRSELDLIFDGSTRSVTYQDLQNMNYLELVIKESLRLYPSVPFIARTARENIPLRNGKYILPSRGIANLFIYDLHHDSTVFPDPDKFDPDRFLPENCRNRHPYAYVPFSAGPRNCIGQRFAMLEVKTVISSILRKYEVEAVDKPEDLILISDLVLRSKNGIHVKFKPRNAHET